LNQFLAMCERELTWTFRLNCDTLRTKEYVETWGLFMAVSVAVICGVYVAFTVLLGMCQVVPDSRVRLKSVEGRTLFYQEQGTLNTIGHTPRITEKEVELMELLGCDKVVLKEYSKK